MKKIAVSIVLIALVLNANDNVSEYANVKQEGIKYIKMLGKELKTNLKAKLKADPSGVGAFGFCSAKAEEITKEVNAKLPKGVSVRRVSLKTRNPKNSPDSTDKKVLEEFEKMAKEHKLSPKNIVVADINGTKRVYKPLLVKKVCLKCHGTNVSDDIKRLIKERYPYDAAIGYKEGDFRGAIVAEMKK